MKYYLIFLLGTFLGVSYLFIAQKNNKTVSYNESLASNIEYEGNIQVIRKKTDSGLQYEVIQEGSGALPQKGQHVTVHYTGWLDNKGEPGAQFDSSIDRGKPFTFIVGIGQVIKGWDEGVMAMKVGEKRRLIIPSDLGYGAHGVGGVIPPHA
ncbi:MAG: FKBP-type peptidyl-prolyl cis-trans isomerase, partial [bacterium]|nr:FKBP-type peptidyl-prolyl cis-trans isomerase [bacterium]